jgi:hypothetical protein
VRKAFEIVSRDEELGRLRAFVDDVEGGLSALLLEGEAGIGKSTLWAGDRSHVSVERCAGCDPLLRGGTRLGKIVVTV